MIIPRVMIIIASDTVSGPAKGIFQLLEYNNRQVCYYLYNFRTNENKPASFLEGAMREGLEVRLFNQGGKPYMALIGQVQKELRGKKINIVQTHGYKASLIGFFLKLRYGVKWVCSMHGRTSEDFKVRIYQQLDRWVQNFADRVVFVSRAERDNTFCRGGSKRINIIHNAIDPARPAPLSRDKDSVRERLGINSDAQVISVLARLSPEKGVDIFIRAFVKVAAAMPEARALLVGDGQERRTIEEQTKQLGLQNRVHFIGHTETPGDFICASDLIVLPSRYEGLPNVALEAMAFQKPIIATRVGGIPEVIENGVSGLLVPPEDSDALAGAMLKVLHDPQLAQRLSEEGRYRLERHFSPEIRAHAWFAVYRELLVS